MLFREPGHIKAIREGAKTATRRDWADNYNRPNEGSIHQATTAMFTSDAECDCFIRIKAVYQEPLGEMTNADARAEGGYDLADFREAWERINGGWDPAKVVDVVEFEYVGRERPSEAEVATDGGSLTGRERVDVGSGRRDEGGDSVSQEMDSLSHEHTAPSGYISDGGEPQAYKVECGCGYESETNRSHETAQTIKRNHGHQCDGQPEIVGVPYVADGGMEPTEWVLQKVADLTEPVPDGHQNNQSNVYTGIDRMRNEGRKGKVPISKVEAEDAVKELADRGRLLYWHGLLAPASEEHLTAVIQNEQQATEPRTLLVAKANRLLQEIRADAEPDEAVADGGLQAAGLPYVCRTCGHETTIYVSPKEVNGEHAITRTHRLCQHECRECEAERTFVLAFDVAGHEEEIGGWPPMPALESHEWELASDGGRPEPKTKTLQSGDEVHEADDCRFVASPAGTVHERREWPGEAHDYDYHPKCGQRLPVGSMWSRVEADSPAEAVLKYDLKPCSKCIDNSYELKLQRAKRYSPTDLDHVEEKTYPFEQDEDQEVATDGGTTAPHGWICTGCGKVTSTGPHGSCYDCGSPYRPATAEDLACDVCGEADANKIFGERTRLCDRHLEQVQYHEQFYLDGGRTLDEEPGDESLVGPPDRMAFEFQPGDCVRVALTEEPVYVIQKRLWNFDSVPDDPYWPEVDYQKTYRIGEVAGLGHPTKLVSEAEIHEHYERIAEERAKAIAFDSPRAAEAFNWGDSA